MDKKLKADAAKFGFEDLEVWQKAADFADKIISVVDKLNTDRRHNRLIEQLESSATSVPMNIAEGKGRCSKREFVPFLYIARYSLGDTTILSLRTHSPFGYTRACLVQCKLREAIPQIVIPNPVPNECEGACEESN